MTVAAPSCIAMRSFLHAVRAADVRLHAGRLQPTVAYRPYYSLFAGGGDRLSARWYQPWLSYAVTTYRPFLGTYETRLVPYTTYRPYYAPAIAYAYSPCPSCSPCAVAVRAGWRLQFLRIV